MQPELNFARVVHDHLAGTHPPDLLWHYTSQKGLLGILKSKTLWASDLRYLNDPREGSYGFDVISAAVASRLSAATDDEKRLYDAMSRSLRSALPASYVASWSQADDDLTQWRAYSGSGTGYAIVTEGPPLKSVASSQGYSLAACIYDVELHNRYAQEIIDASLAEMIEEGQKGGVQYDEHNPAPPLIKRVRQLAPLFKHPAFAQEREWRLIAQLGDHPAKLDVRESRSTLIPYTVFEFPLRLIYDLVVGPCVEQGLAWNGALRALESCFDTEEERRRIVVLNSSVPFRNW